MEKVFLQSQLPTGGLLKVGGEYIDSECDDDKIKIELIGPFKDSCDVQPQATSRTTIIYGGHTFSADDKSEIKIEEEQIQMCNEYTTTFLEKRSDENSDSIEKADGNSLTCTLCLNKLSSKSGLKRHINNVHLGRKPFSCTECPKNFSSNWYLSVHFQIHSNEKLFICDECPKRFSSKAFLKSHKRTHKAEKTFACSDCPMKFIHRSSRDAHKAVHTAKYWFSCDECSKKFSRKAYLKAHKRTHDSKGTKKYECYICRYKSTFLSYLHKHMSKHTGRVYTCDKCPKRYYLMPHLKRHKLVHLPQKPFICNECPKAFYDKCALTIHIRSHSGEKPYACDECTIAFSCRPNIIRHKRLHRPKPIYSFNECSKNVSRNCLN